MINHAAVSEFTSFQNIEVWNFVIMLAILSGALLLAGALRRMIPLLRKSLLPGAVLAGFLLLVGDGIYRAITGVSFFRSGNNLITLEAMTYHGLGLGIVAMSLKQSQRAKNQHRNREIFRSGAITVCGYLIQGGSGAITVCGYLIQGVVGLLITLAFFYLFKGKVFASSGILLPLGYGQGPGQAFNWGLTFENSYGFVNGSSFGLTVAAMGFVSASVGGVLYMNVMQRKGKLKMHENADEAEDLTAEAITGKGEIALSESMDKFTVQAALILVTYILAYGIMKGIDTAFGGIPFYVKTLQSTIWGFNFLFGLLACVIVKALLKSFKKAGWMQREYRNTFLLNRISGWMFDIMVVASIASIDLTAFAHPEFIVPLVLICAAGAFATFFFVRFASHSTPCSWARLSSWSWASSLRTSLPPPGWSSGSSPSTSWSSAGCCLESSSSGRRKRNKPRKAGPVPAFFYAQQQVACQSADSLYTNGIDIRRNELWNPMRF